MRDWFLVIGGLMIVGVLAHGAWLWLKARRDPLAFRYERDIPDIDVDDIDLLRGELPSGGARVVSGDGARHDPPAPAAPATASGGLAAAVRRSATEAREDPEASAPLSLDLEEQVPVLMDPIDQDVAREAAEDARRHEEPVEVEQVAEPAAEREVPPAVEAVEEADAADEEGAEPAAPAPMGFEQTPLFAGEPIVAPEPARRSRGARKTTRSEKAEGPARKRGAGSRDEDAPAAPEPLGPPEDVIVINVLCRGGEVADGPTLVETITDQGLRFGDMNIFHRTSPEDRGRIDFSLASAVEPGTFDLGAMDEFTTPGVTLFMQLPGPAKPIDAFEDMVTIARGIAARIGADLKDEQHSVMTAQTIEHCRQRVREFTRRQMSRRA
ncbi:MAG: cell division protein ZipA [Pseudomonadales bacterium]|nr:cell division protein ZipA [Pseudomonadales bacterium]